MNRRRERRHPGFVFGETETSSSSRRSECGGCYYLCCGGAATTPTTAIRESEKRRRGSSLIIYEPWRTNRADRSRSSPNSGGQRGATTG